MKNTILLLFLVFGLSVSCESQKKSNNNKLAIDAEKVDTATVAGGCFWCVEAVFDRTEGVVEAVSGYSGGSKRSATYEKVSRGETEHAEAVQIYYDPEKITYGELLEIFFATHDPTQLNRQGPDIGKQYRSAVFYHNQKQRKEVEGYVTKLDESAKFKKPIVTQLNSYREFYIAEDYHQDYYDKHPDNPYIISVTKPKIKKFEKEFRDKLKAEFR